MRPLTAAETSVKGSSPDCLPSLQLPNEGWDLCLLWKWVFPWKRRKPYPGLFKWGNMGKVSTTTGALFAQFKVRRAYFALQRHSSGRQWEEWGWVGGEEGGFRGQEIRIWVINNFCSVIKQAKGDSSSLPYVKRPNIWCVIPPSSTCSTFFWLLFCFISITPLNCPPYSAGMCSLLCYVSNSVSLTWFFHRAIILQVNFGANDVVGLFIHVVCLENMNLLLFL